MSQTRERLYAMLLLYTISSISLPLGLDHFEVVKYTRGNTISQLFYEIKPLCSNCG